MLYKDVVIVVCMTLTFYLLHSINSVLSVVLLNYVLLLRLLLLLLLLLLYDSGNNLFFKLSRLSL